MSKANSAKKFVVGLLADLPPDDLAAAELMQERIKARLNIEHKGRPLTPGDFNGPVVWAGLIVFAQFLNKKLNAEIEIENGKGHELWQKSGKHLQALRETQENRSYEEFIADIDTLVDEVVGDRDGFNFGYARLDEDEKSKIFSSIEQIRVLVEQSNLSDRKKDAVLKRLSALHEEVARSNTRTERVFGFFGDLAMLAGEMAENAEPAIEQAKSILRIVMGKRAEQEGIELPKPENWPRLPAPEKDDQ